MKTLFPVSRALVSLLVVVGFEVTPLASAQVSYAYPPPPAGGTKASRPSVLKKTVPSVGSSKKSTLARASKTSGSTDAAPTTHLVRPGDTMWRIASAHRVSVGELQRVNRLVGENITIGQSLRIPAPQLSRALATASDKLATPGNQPTTGRASSATYTVKKGDSLKAIALRHQVTTAALANANSIQDANKVRVGQNLIIPERSSIAASPAEVPAKIASAPPAPRSSPSHEVPSAAEAAIASATQVLSAAPPKNPSSSRETHRGILAYRIDRSDTLESIAQQFSTTSERIREMNRLQPETMLKSGDEIMVPAMGAVAAKN